MKVKKIVDNKYEMRIEVDGENETIFNMLKDKLLSMDDVDSAGFRKEHPMIDKVEMVILTKNKEAKSVLNKAITELSAELSSLKRGIR